MAVDETRGSGFRKRKSTLPRYGTHCRLQDSHGCNHDGLDSRLSILEHEWPGGSLTLSSSLA